MKKLLKKILLPLLITFGLDFVPIKNAVTIDDSKIFSTNEYLCSFAQVTGGNWEVENLENQLYIEDLMGTSPLNCLDKNFSTDYLEPSGNKYIFRGNINPKKADIYDLNVEEWDIVYPIQRKSFRMLYAPKNYLTLYDYDWFKIIWNIIK